MSNNSWNILVREDSQWVQRNDSEKVVLTFKRYERTRNTTAIVSFKSKKKYAEKYE